MSTQTLFADVIDPKQRQCDANAVADAALAKGPQAKAGLPTDLRAGFDAIIQAFAHYEAGRDDEARISLQVIGLQSPFLEWKLLIRGLIAYAAKDDPRALENWQRLDPKRLPARLCAPLRANIDSAFLVAQPPTVQNALRRLAEQASPITPLLRELRDLIHKERLGQAFRKLGAFMPILQREHPALVPRLAQVFYWAIIDHGEADDLARYAQRFGPPVNDPKLFRLQSLAMETRGLRHDAHQAWQHFIREAAANSTAWPGESSKRVQALIWARMADNAASSRGSQRATHPLSALLDQMPKFKPSAEQCLEHAIKLAPDQLDYRLSLFACYQLQGKDAKAKQIAQELLQRFPDNVETLSALGRLCMKAKEFNEALEYFEKAIHANPLDQSLRSELARARQNLGLTLTIAKEFDTARSQYEQALALWDGSKTPLLCQWAVAEMKAKNPERAAELIAQVQAEPDHRLACLFSLVGESVRAKLPPAEKKRMAEAFKEALAQMPTPTEIVVLIESAAHQRKTHDDSFHGQKTQERTIVKFLEQVDFAAYDDQQLVRLCESLRLLEARKPWLRCLIHARRAFRRDPRFCLSHADYYLSENTYYVKVQEVRRHLDEARRLAEKLPRGEMQQRFLDEIKQREELLVGLSVDDSPLRDIMDRIFDGFGDGNDDGDF
jgi:tetratricopeptide (TPR) repeat protein